MPRRSSAAGTAAVSRSSSSTVPEVGSTIRLTIRSEVVLPQPDGPTSTVIRPDGATRSRPSTAVVPSGYRFTTESDLITRITASGKRQGTRLGHVYQGPLTVYPVVHPCTPPAAAPPGQDPAATVPRVGS